MGKSARSVSIIGGADGPTSIFIVGKSGKINILECLKRYCYRKKRSKIEKMIIADAHTLEEVVIYLKKRFNAKEISQKSSKYLEQQKCLKESLIMNYHPELLGGLTKITSPDSFDDRSLNEFWKQLELRRKKAQTVGDDVFPMDYHLYEIRYLNKGSMQIDIENVWGQLAISYSGEKKVMKQMKKICKAIYLYYGVSDIDIKNKSERYSSLVAALCS